MIIQWYRAFSLLFAMVFLGGCQSQKEEISIAEAVLQPVSLQLQWITQSQFAGYYVAHEKGWYREAGIDLSIYEGGPDLVPVDLVAASSRDFGTTLLPDLAVSIHKGQKVKAIAQIQQVNGLRLLARKDSGIRTPEDLVGKNVGVWLGSWEIQFTALLASRHIDPKEINIISQGWSMKPFLDGQFDAASAMIYNEYFRLIEAGMMAENIHIIDYRDYGQDFPGDVLFTSDLMLKEQPDLCRKMVEVSIRGWKYAVTHPKEAARIVLKYDKGKIQSYEHQMNMLRALSRMIVVDMDDADYSIGTFRREKVEQMLKMLTLHGIMTFTLFPEDIYDDRFLNVSGDAGQ